MEHQATCILSVRAINYWTMNRGYKVNEEKIIFETEQKQI